MLEGHRLEKVLIGGSIQNILSCFGKAPRGANSCCKGTGVIAAFPFWAGARDSGGRKSERRALDASTVKEIGRYLASRGNQSFLDLDS